MDVPNEKFQRKRKKFTKSNNLTTGKKSKRYRLAQSKLCEKSTRVSSSLSDSKDTDYFPQNKEKGIQTNESKEMEDTSVQATVKTFVKSKQSTPLTYSKGAQINIKNVSKRSVCVQTKKEKNAPNVKTTKSTLLLEKLNRNQTFEQFARKLDENEQTEKFVNCVISLSSGDMKFTNMAWKSFLDMGTLYSCTSTTNMEYDREWLEFCQVIYHMFGAGVINALRGRGHFLQVTSSKAKKGKYKPAEGEFNFPISSIPTLKKLDIGFPTEIPVGFIEQSLKIAEKKAEDGCQFILSFDGKLIAPGCKGENCSDSNMWGVEGPPNLKTAVKTLKCTLAVAKQIEVDMNNVSLSGHFLHCKELLNISLWRIKRLRGRMTGSFYLRKKLIEKCGDSQELQYKHRRQMSTLNQNTAECESVVRRLLELNLKVTSIMAFMNCNGDVHIRNDVRHITLIDRANNFQLLPPEIVGNFIDLETPENVQFIKQ